MQRTLVGPSRAQNEPVRPKNRFHLKFLINQNSKYEIDTNYLDSIRLKYLNIFAEIRVLTSPGTGKVVII